MATVGKYNHQTNINPNIVAALPMSIPTGQPRCRILEHEKEEMIPWLRLLPETERRFITLNGTIEIGGARTIPLR